MTSLTLSQIQGGDPTGTGKGRLSMVFGGRTFSHQLCVCCVCAGGESVWGKPFGDEIKPNLTHSGESCSGRQWLPFMALLGVGRKPVACLAVRSHFSVIKCFAS